MANNIVKVIAMQHQHVYTLLNKIKDLEKQLTESLLEKKDWHEFVKQYVDETTLKYITADLQGNWYDKNLYDYLISYDFYRGNSMYDDSNEIKYLDMTIGVCKKGQNNLRSKNGVPIILNIVTTPISIADFNMFLNDEIKSIITE